MIDPAEAERAERFECSCGRSLDVKPIIVCTGCDYPPHKCTCEGIDGEEEDDAKASR